MTEGQIEPFSQVVPFMGAALVCDAIAVDSNSGKKSLIGIFDQINALEFPTQRFVTLYFRISDAQGRYQMNVKFVSLRDGKVLSETTQEIFLEDRLMQNELVWVIPPLEVPTPGKYEFQLWANSAFVGSALITAEVIPQQTRLQG